MADHEKMDCCFFTNFAFGFFKKYAARLAVEKAIFSICLTNALLATFYIALVGIL